MNKNIHHSVPFRWLAAGLSLILLNSCIASPTPLPTPTTIPLAKELIFYDWEADMPQSVLDAFTAEYGVKIKYLVYEAQEEAIANIEAGQIYDVAVMESRFIPQLAQKDLLAELHHDHLSNLKNISASFRELAYDPDNEYSIPYNWGTTGLVVRSDLLDEPVTHWSDLWDARYAGRVAVWMGQRREIISLTLKSLGYSANSEDAQQLKAALHRLIQLKHNAFALEDYDLSSSTNVMVEGKAVISMGYAYDALSGQEKNPAIEYVLPQEGALLWNDTFIVPKASANQSTAEVFLNFLLRPEINAMIANENLYATPNEAARLFIEPEILNNPVIFPKNKALVNAELVLPLTSSGQALYDQVWEQFTKAP